MILAEPGALIGFAGARVIKDTTKQTLPAGFQTAEFLLKHGLIDQIVSRIDMRDRLRDSSRRSSCGKSPSPPAPDVLDTRCRPMLPLGRLSGRPGLSVQPQGGRGEVRHRPHADSWHRDSAIPERAVPCIHVAGTNGKGSVSAMLESILRASGRRRRPLYLPAPGAPGRAGPGRPRILSSEEEICRLCQRAAAHCGTAGRSREAPDDRPELLRVHDRDGVPSVRKEDAAIAA